MQTATGRLWGLGLGPGDPELITVKALRLIEAAPVVAYHAAGPGRSNARAIAAGYLKPEQIEEALIYPVTTGGTDHPGGYDGALLDFYEAAAARLAVHLDAGRDVAVLCEGDPLFYGSYMYLHDRLAGRYPAEVVPGIPAFAGATARLDAPLVRRDSTVTILPGTLSEAELVRRLAAADSAVVMKLGRHFEKVRRALARAGLDGRARYIERATMAAERVIPLAAVDPAEVPYFSLIVVPAGPVSTGAPATDPAGGAPASREGGIAVVGLGPGGGDWLSPEVRTALGRATDLVGYKPYLDRVPAQAGQIRHASDNKVEIERANHAFELALQGRRVCVVSSGDPGIFAMAAAVMEAAEQGPESYRSVPVRVLPGISALQAAAARFGAPLGHDFCVVSLSDRLKPWSVIEQRLAAAAAADFALALYNPISSERRWQLGAARDVLARHRAPETPVLLARDLGGVGERLHVTDLAGFDPGMVDMRTIVLVGASTTRRFQWADGRPAIYTPRSYREPSRR